MVCLVWFAWLGLVLGLIHFVLLRAVVLRFVALLLCLVPVCLFSFRFVLIRPVSFVVFCLECVHIRLLCCFDCVVLFGVVVLCVVMLCVVSFVLLFCFVLFCFVLFVVCFISFCLVLLRFVV